MSITVNLDYRDIELLSKILDLKPFVSMYSLSRLLGKSKASISKRLRKLEEKGFRFTVDIDYLAIGLKLDVRIIQGYKDIEDINARFLHSIINLMPNNTLISYYKPVTSRQDHYHKSLGGQEHYLEADEVFGSIPAFKKYFDSRKSEIIVDKHQLINDIINSTKRSSGIIAEIRDIERLRRANKAKITEMDLKIVSLLEEYGIISPKDIAKRLKLKESKVARRLSLISRYIKSVSLSRTPWSKNLPLTIVSLIKAKRPGYAKNIVSVLLEHPLHKKTYLSTLTGEFMTMFYVNDRIARVFTEILNELSMDGLVDYYMTWATTSTNWKQYKLIEGPRYSKYMGSWVHA